MKTKITIIILVLATSLSFAQRKLADKFFKNYGYIKAIELYEEAVEKGDSSAHVLTRLGDAYYNNSKSAKAALWYGEAVKRHEQLEPEYLYKYIQSLRSIGAYEKADKWFKALKDQQSEDSRLRDYNPDEIDIYSTLQAADTKVVEIKNLDFNTENSDFGGYRFNDTLFFASARNSGGKIYSWNKEPFLDLYQINIEDEDSLNFGEVTPINADPVNTDYHEATLAITKDGNTMYFTRDNVNRRNRLEYDKEGTTHLKLYKTVKENGNWSKAEELPFNDDVFSTGHPALSPDEKTLFFVSDRASSIGQTDVYAVDIYENGSYGEPYNLGSEVNTEGREMFPFVAKDSTFYFSSDGHLNLGLLDIFKSDILKTDDTTEPENLGAPYNSGYDDFAIFVDSETQQGFFSSNRPEGKGNDDIYSFNAYQCQQTVIGNVKDNKTNISLPNATVQLIDEQGKIIEEVQTNSNGEYTLEVDCNKTYTILATKDDYKDDQRTLTTSKDNKTINEVNLMLTPLLIDNQIVINPIFFDFDKWNIRTDAEYELENIVDVMRKHPTMVIKIESHTDSRGSDRYNLKLSDRRAKSTRDYLLSRGIAPERIESAIGYGETQLLNKCSNGVKCSKEEHQLNRRSYFYIVKE